MKETIKVGIVGYGNLGRGAEAAIQQQPDMKLVAVFTRREPSLVHVLDPEVKVLPIEAAKDYTNTIDVMILCGGSATDLPEQVPFFC